MADETAVSEKVLPFLIKIRDASIGQKPISDLLSSLHETYNPDQIMQILVPFLFNDKEPLSSDGALAVMSALVNSDASTYLTCASRAVLSCARGMADATTASERVTVSPQLLQVFVMQLHGNNTQVAENAAQVLVACSRRLGTPFVQSAFEALQQTCQTAWKEMANDKQSSTTVVRCVSAMVDLAILEDSFFVLAPTSTWTRLLQYDQDPLLQLSSLDLFERLATSKPFHHSRSHWLLSSDGLQTILQMAGSLKEFPPDPLLGGAALRVISAMCHLLHSSGDLEESSPGLLKNFHHALHTWHELSNGEMDRLALIHAISSFASASDDALQLVLDDPVTRQAWLSLQSVSQSKLKAAILVSIAQVLTEMPSPSSCATLFSAVGPVNNQHTTMDLLLDLVKSPMSEVRVAVYALWEAMAPHGAQTMLLHPNFLPLLLKREQETTQEGHEAKYAIVQAIVASSVVGLLAQDIVKQLETYIKQGPHFHAAQRWEVATE